ncbi:MAG: SUMF1/EgtB/PvdO family nonheme iron enzyme [Anaerolineales bacterium]|nr:SUMF1/EgtB/PvdO family nonheme iron enzyme [Anaerolineales bacterium]
MTTTRPLKVFLCHASADKPNVRKLYAYLKKQKIDAWLDAEKLLGGQNWRTEIPKAIKASDAIIVCLSKNSINKEGYIQKEIKFALDKAEEMPSGRIFIIPAKLEECEAPDELADYHWVNLFEEDGYRRLMRSLRARAAQIGTVTEISDLPHDEETEPLESKDNSIGVGGDVSGANIIVGNNNVIHVVPSVGQASSLTDTPNEKVSRIGNPTYEDEPVGQVSNLTNAPTHEEENAKREAAQKVERESFEKAARERLEREKAERRKAVQNAKESQAKSLTYSKFPVWGIGLIAFAIFALAVWGLSSIPASPAPNVTATATSQATVTLLAPTETPVPATPTIIPTPTLGIGSTEISDKDGMTLLYVPAGKFTMGDKAEDALAECKKYRSDCQLSWFTDEQPPHEVFLDAFWIDQTEVTNAMYAKCVDDGSCKSPSNTGHFSDSNYANHPVVYVDWNMANTYCSWAGRQLPSEAQWEKAASWDENAQTKRVYPWGNEAPNKDLLNYNQNVGDTTKVGSYESGKSFYGAYDMAGNVWEWVSSLYKPYPYDANDGRENMSSTDTRALRGGSWNYVENFVRSAIRFRYIPALTDNYFGFRCSRSRP